VPHPRRAGAVARQPGRRHRPTRPAGARPGPMPRWAWSQRRATLWRYCAAARR